MQQMKKMGGLQSMLSMLPGVGNILLPAVAALISGSVYMLPAAKLQKFGGITIMGL